MKKSSPLNDYVFNNSSPEAKAPPGTVNQPSTQAPTPQESIVQPVTPATGGIHLSYRALALVASLAALLGYSIFLHRANTAQEKEIVQMDTQLAVITQRLEESDDRLADLTAQFQVSTERLGLTQSELNRTRAMAARLKKEQQERVRELSEELGRKAGVEQLAALQEQTTSTIGALSSDVSTTQQKVALVDKGVSETRKEVTDLKLKLSEFGTLIARNKEELAYLRRRGDRDYFEFDIRKGSFYQVSDLQLKLKKADVKRHRFDIEYIANDRKHKRKKVYANEPIQVLVKGLRKPYEIVVNKVQKNRIIGYVSAPKDRGQAPGAPIK